MKRKDWIEELKELGFNKIEFPILIKDEFDLNLIYDLKQFAVNPDLYYFEFRDDHELIDSSGKVFIWKYDRVNKTNLPGTLKRTLTFEELKEKVDTYFKDYKTYSEIKNAMKNATSIKELLENIANYF